ncbi:hypothetical protein YPPY06_1623, partial [Yersinia pestis PY-06]
MITQQLAQAAGGGG